MDEAGKRAAENASFTTRQRVAEKIEYFPQKAPENALGLALLYTLSGDFAQIIHSRALFWGKKEVPQNFHSATLPSIEANLEKVSAVNRNISPE